MSLRDLTSIATLKSETLDFDSARSSYGSLDLEVWSLSSSQVICNSLLRSHVTLQRRQRHCLFAYSVKISMLSRHQCVYRQLTVAPN